MNSEAYAFWSRFNDWLNDHSLLLGMVQLSVGALFAIDCAHDVHRLRNFRRTLVPQNFAVARGAVKDLTISVETSRGRSRRSRTTYFFSAHFGLANQPGKYHRFLGQRFEKDNVPGGIAEGQTISCTYYLWNASDALYGHDCEPDLNEAMSGLESANTVMQSIDYASGALGLWLLFLGIRRLRGYKS